MRLVKTSGGPKVALDPDVVLILANTTHSPIIRQAALAWLDSYRQSRIAGVDDLSARLGAVDAFDAALCRPPANTAVQKGPETMNESTLAKQAAPTSTTLTPGIYEVQLQSQKRLVIVLEEQPAEGPVRAIRLVRSEHSARHLRHTGLSISPEQAEVLKLCAQFFEA